MKNVVAYCRVSTNNQAGDYRFGIDVQKEWIMDYCAKNDMQISDWYIDEGESGVKENRPELDRLLYGEIQNPPVECVIVAKSDRIAREIKLYFYYMMLLQKKGIELISATEPVVDDGSGLGNVYKAIMLFVAEQERNNITKRTSGGRRVKAAGGGYSGGRAPYGYRVVDRSLVVNEEEADTVRFIYSLRRSGKMYKEIIEALNAGGYKTRKGKPWVISSAQSILENENTYKGFYKYGKNGNWVKGQHEAILGEE